jgi:hypothetical protein
MEEHHRFLLARQLQRLERVQQDVERLDQRIDEKLAPYSDQLRLLLLVEAAQAAARAKRTYLRDNFYRLKARRGYKRALMAVAHKILVAIYHMLSIGVSYEELGESYLDQLDTRRIATSLVARLGRLEYEVRIEEHAA